MGVIGAERCVLLSFCVPFQLRWELKTLMPTKGPNRALLRLGFGCYGASLPIPHRLTLWLSTIANQGTVSRPFYDVVNILSARLLPLFRLYKGMTFVLVVQPFNSNWTLVVTHVLKL